LFFTILAAREFCSGFRSMKQCGVPLLKLALAEMQAIIRDMEQ
jgi:hypothetical protein